MNKINILSKNMLILYTFLIASLMLLGSCFQKQAINKNALIQQIACVKDIELGNYDKAKSHCQICLEFQDSMAECLNGLGLIWFKKNDTDKALEYFSKAVRQNKNFVQALNNIGVIYFQQGNFNKSLGYFQNVAQINPGYKDGRYNLALNYLRIAQQLLTKKNVSSAKEFLTKATGEYDKLIALYPSYANAYRNMGVIMSIRANLAKMQQKQDEYLAKADGYFKQCLQVSPNNVSCHQSYGEVLLYQNKYEDALDQFVKCLSQDKDNMVCSAKLQETYNYSEMKSKAIGKYLQIIKQNPGNANAHYELCKAQYNKGLNKLATAECQAAVKLDPNICPAYYELAMHYKSIFNSRETLSNCYSFLNCTKQKGDIKKVNQCKKLIKVLSSK